MDRTVVKYGPIIKFLFNPTKPKMEERVESGDVGVGVGVLIDGAMGRVGVVFGA